MTKFDEYRERAYAFHKKTGCDLELYDVFFYLVKKNDRNKMVFSCEKDGGLRHYRSIGVLIDRPLSTESEWLSAIEAHFGQPFPTLLEAQGWSNEKFLSASQIIVDAIKNASNRDKDYANVNWEELQMEWIDWLEDEFGGGE